VRKFLDPVLVEMDGQSGALELAAAQAGEEPHLLELVLAVLWSRRALVAAVLLYLLR